MFAFLKKLFADPTADWPKAVPDPVFGELRLSEDGDCWEAAIAIDGRSVNFYIAGEGRPDPALVAHAHEIVRDFGEFERRVAASLAGEAEAAQWRSLAGEIRQLTLESIGLHRAPADGMIYFNGPDEYRVWRCDYVNGRPTGLGLDD